MNCILSRSNQYHTTVKMIHPNRKGSSGNICWTWHSRHWSFRSLIQAIQYGLLSSYRIQPGVPSLKDSVVGFIFSQIEMIMMKLKNFLLNDAAGSKNPKLYCLSMMTRNGMCLLTPYGMIASCLLNNAMKRLQG